MMNSAGCHAGRIGAWACALLARPCSGVIVGGTIALVAAVLLTAAFVFGLDWTQTWRTIGFPGVALPPFFDLQAITNTAAECASAGQTYPYADCGYRTGNYNYPPVWLLLARIGITPGDTAWLAVLVELPAIVLLIILLRGRSAALGLVALPMVLSPSTILAIERANTDLVEWSLVCAAALIYSERRRAATILAASLLCLAITLKFLALFCTSLIVRFTRAAIFVSATLVVFTALYLYSIADVLPHIRRISPVSPYISYGYTIIFDRFELLYAPRLGLNVAGLSKSWVPHAAIVFVLALAAAIAVIAWRKGTEALRLDDGRNGTAFLFGAGIYCGSFLLLGTNYTYRLIFLLLCLPQLFDWIERSKTSRRIAQLMIVSCIVSMWLKFHPEKTLHINQVTDWMLFGIMMTIMALASLRSLWPMQRDATVN
jgi:hypothetical protein